MTTSICTTADNGPDKRMTISRGKWARLTRAEKELAQKMGIVPESAPALTEDELAVRELEKKAKLSLKREPYILGIIEACQLCGTERIFNYEMIQATKGNGSCLIAEPYRGSQVPDKWEIRKVYLCICCKDTLKTWTRQELISKVIEVSYTAFYKRR